MHLQSQGGAHTPFHGSKVANHASIQETNGIKPVHSQQDLDETREDGPQISLNSHCQGSKEVKGRQEDKRQCRGVEAHKLPLRDRSSSPPLLHDLILKDSNPKADANKERKKRILLSLGRRCNRLQGKKNPTTQNCTLTRIQDQDHSGGTSSISYLDQVSPPSLTSQPSIDTVYAGHKMVPLTDDEINDLIAKRVKHFRSILASENHSAYHKKDVVALDDISGRHSTEYPNIMVQYAPTYKKDEERTLLIHPTVPEMSLYPWTEKHPGSSINCGSSEEENNITNTLNDKDPGEKPMKAIRLDNVQTDVFFQSKSTSLPSGNNKEKLPYATVSQDTNGDESAWTRLNSSVDLIQKEISSAGGIVWADVESVSSQTDFRIADGEKLREPAHVSENGTEEVLHVGVLKNQQYEDISDDGNTQCGSNLPNAESGKVIFPTQYEDISDALSSEHEKLNFLGNFNDQPYEDEGQDEKIECNTMEKPFLKQTPEPEFSVFEDDEIDDHWIFGPIIVSDLEFEAKDMKDCPEKVAQSDSETGNKDWDWSTSKPLSVCHLPVFETVGSFLRAKIEEFRNRFKVRTEGSPTLHESHSVLQDSSETEDSDDYSSGSDHNILTVSKQVFKKRSSIHKVKGVSKGQTRNSNKLSCMQKLKQPITKAGPKNGQHETNQQRKTEKNDVIILDSDTENEIFQSCKKKAKPLLSSSSEDSSESSCFNQSSLKRSSATRQSIPHNTQSEVVMKTPSSNFSHATEIRGPMRENTNRQKISTKDTVITLDSDLVHSVSSESESSGTDSKKNVPNFKKQNKERLVSSGSSECDDAQCGQQMRHSREAVESKYGLAHVNIQKAKRCSAGKIAGKLIKGNGGSAHVDPMTKRKKFSEKRHIVACDSNKPTYSDKGTWLSSGSDDSSKDLKISKRRASTHVKDHLSISSNQRSKNSRLPAGNASNEQCQNVDEDADSSPVIPRYVVEFSQSNKCLKMVKFNKQGEYKASLAPTANCKKTNSLEKDKDHLDRNEKDRFEHTTKPANGGENTVQPTVGPSKSFSRQFSLPCQKCPNSPIRSLPSSSGHCSEPRQTAASSGLGKSEQSTGIARQQSFTPIQQQPSSSGNPSTSGHPYAPTRVPLSSPTMQPSARKRLKQDWEDSHVPTKLDRKMPTGVEEVTTTTACDSSRKQRRKRRHSLDDRPPRPKFHEAQTPLMKKTKFEAQQWTRDRNRETKSKQRHSVGEGYKWAVKPTVGKPRKRFRQEPDELTYSS